jgi:4'-phosphopantetheinyl transferase
VEDEVRIWRASLDLGPLPLVRLAGLLSDDERGRAGQFHFSRDATRFVVARASLRLALAECLDVEPAAIRFRYGDHGKPGLAPPFDRSGLQFNVSHTDGIGLIAVTPGRRVGVDIERIRPLPDLHQIAERVFSPAERRVLRELPPHRQPEGFFNGWTRKEAYVKAIGAGLIHPLTRFSVSLAPGDPARLETVEGDAAAPDRWRLHALESVPGCAAAVAVEGPAARLSVLFHGDRAGPPGNRGGKKIPLPGVH